MSVVLYWHAAYHSAVVLMGTTSPLPPTDFTSYIVSSFGRDRMLVARKCQCRLGKPPGVANGVEGGQSTQESKEDLPICGRAQCGELSCS